MVDVPLESLTGSPPVQRSSAGRTFYLETFGCQMNVHDSEKVAGLLQARGYRQVNHPERADLVLYNTCSIREKAAQKVFAHLGQHKRAPEQGRVVGVLGCVAQQEGEHVFDRAPWVSLVCGSASYRRLPQLLDRLETGDNRVTGLDLDVDRTFETEVTRRDHPFRAYVTIIEGCDKHCAFCVVPSTRGPERSRPSSAVLSEVRRLARTDYSEVQFLGQTVDSWRDAGPAGLTFAQLLLAAADVPGIRRVRFTTSHPRDFHPDIIRAIDSCATLCEHVHLPVQSGSNRVLEIMRRGYSREEYLATVALVRSARRPISLTTDVIVGFPGETEDDFASTLDLLERARYDGVFAFKYSPRPNTPAAAWPDQVPEEEKSRRLAVLLDRQRQIQLEHNWAMIGRSVEVLIDGRHDARGQWTGRTSSNRVVNFTSPLPALLGQYAQVVITKAGPNSLVGEHSA
ncbi:MAG TPA: tRNA (N6-isopentenyl adenosine(37)-C2)-methylthiotransferase MiaB [Candidatus Acidoferrales bacterium]|nr:tRNA (N6-isopentenyl adenosine(37)-C2)-methylthiotransferase MiaB [Candidatus Acidoferrales bacterium]